MEYPITDEELADVENRHTYHPPTDEQIERYAKIREAAKEFELLIRCLCPLSEERSVALTNLGTVTFWANASIARNE